MYKADQTTLEMASFAIEGHVVDHSWPHIVTRENGKPDQNAIALLSMIVYWYRPVDTRRDDGTGGLGKRYKADLLQKSYAKIEEELGLTKREAQAAFETLERHDFAHRVLRTIEIDGQKISNILFIKLNHKNLSFKREQYFKKCISSYAKKDEGVRQNVQGDTPNVTTYTENTTENTTVSCFVSVDQPPVGADPLVKITEKVDCNGKTFSISKQDLFKASIQHRKDWSEKDIDFAWDVLVKYQDPIRDWVKFIDGTITNNRKVKKVKSLDKTETKQQSQDPEPSKTQKPWVKPEVCEGFKKWARTKSNEKEKKNE